MSDSTFRIATGTTREAWFIVMHPDQTGQSSSGRPRKSGASSQTKTALTYNRAIFLLSRSAPENNKGPITIPCDWKCDN
ncbi:hypothetical protein BFJ68_g17394 [Fusarium oxysporum]|uniref:Uncharacterized protein n=1 Tax=Fusarium oxysporum TaxID=5507 RepID=A0A420NUG5_FUSOX|nr:hypothetical protein BFJ68_g17394 [Fusarium oxysporum]